ncbi:hypothetical protein HI914_06398 [Erysiphe necator]|nr:hypothetical protein HI914_06398 [Erysiphe necator]
MMNFKPTGEALRFKITEPTLSMRLTVAKKIRAFGMKMRSALRKSTTTGAFSTGAGDVNPTLRVL